MDFPPELDTTDSSDSEGDSDSLSSGYFTPNDSDSEELLLAGDLLASHLESAWNECFDCSDVILRPGQPDDQTSQDSVSVLEIRCHKFVLAARSKVFRAMFQQNKNESTFELPDIQEYTLVTLLNFMYSDKVLEKDVDMKLLAAANQFDIPELKIVCSHFLERQVSPTFASISNQIHAIVTCKVLLN